MGIGAPVKACDRDAGVDGTRRRVPLSRSDLDRIRSIVREELRQALGRHDDPHEEAPAAALATAEQDGRDAISELVARARRKARERAARPIPEGPYVDRYDAARLLDITQDTVSGWAKQGRLRTHREGGRVMVSREDIDAEIKKRKPRRRR